jgi:hypothetical protein
VAVDGDTAADEQLCAALQKHLRINASNAFAEHAHDGRAAKAAPHRAVSKAVRGQVGHSSPIPCAAFGLRIEFCVARMTFCIPAHARSCLQGRVHQNGQLGGQAPALSCEQFIAEMSPLLELERAAEVATAQVSDDKSPVWLADTIANTLRPVGIAAAFA